MIDVSLKTIHKNLFLNHKENRKQTVIRLGLVNADGVLNEEQIATLAQYDSKKMNSNLLLKTILSLMIQMEQHIEADEWEELACVLYLHFYLMRNRAPIIFRILVAHDEVFQMYCKYFHQKLCDAQ